MCIRDSLGKHHLEHVPIAVDEVCARQLQAELGNAALLEACEVGARQSQAAGVEGGEVHQLPKAHPCGDVGEIELAAHEVNVHAVEAETHHALQPVLFRKQRLSGIIQDETPLSLIHI